MRKFFGIVFLLAFVFGIFGWLTYRYRLAKEGPSPILAYAEFYRGATSNPEALEFTRPGGQTFSIMAEPGQLQVFLNPASSTRDIRELIKPYDGTIIGQIPSIGYYLIAMPPRNAVRAAADLVDSNKIRAGGPNELADFSQTPASPDEIKPVGTATVAESAPVIDLTDQAKPQGGQVAALLTSPEPGSNVTMAIIDQFRQVSPTERPHGELVYQEAVKVMGEHQVQRIGVSQCDQKKCWARQSDVINAIVASVAGAQLNGQNLVINMSIGPVIQTSDLSGVDQHRVEGANDWAVPKWRDWQKNIYQALRNLVEQDKSGWIKDHVVIAMAAGNGVRYVDPATGEIKDEFGIDVSQGKMDLKRMYPDIYDLIAHTGVDLEGVLRAEYSNFGTDVLVKDLPRGTSGSSFTSPQTAGAMFRDWKNNPRISGGDVSADARGAPRKPATPPAQTPVVQPTPMPAKPKPKPTPPPTPAPTPVAAPAPAAHCPNNLQVCGVSCIPTNAVCCNANLYCLLPGGSCSPLGGTCHDCPAGMKFCGMFCVDQSQDCATGNMTPAPAPTPAPVPAPTPAPVPAPSNLCTQDANCGVYAANHCGKGFASCDTRDGTCHCMVQDMSLSQYGWAFLHCPCSSGSYCINIACVENAGGFTNQ